mmetsp:Transcript_46806/g.92725  ORF Transcript_46806/g.92725 Transcript_46806/m.92725 type:complete len:239 (+) Transcript_46806:318-1034(+)
MLHHRLVPAVEIRLQELLQVRRLLDGAEDFRAGHELFPDLRPIQRGHRHNDGVEHEILELDEFHSGKGRHHIQEQSRGFLPIARNHQVDALVDLQLVPPLPVAALPELDLRAVDFLLHERNVVEEQRDPDDRQDIVQLATDAHGLFEGLLVSLNGSLFVADPVEELRLRQQCVPHLDVAEILLCVSDPFFELGQVFIVFLLHLRLQRLVGGADSCRTQILLVVRQHGLLLHDGQDLRL